MRSRVLFAGPRDVGRDEAQKAFRDAMWPLGSMITEAVTGGCRGADSAAYDMMEGLVPIKVFPADWKTHGKAAGPMRNREMARYADVLIAIWDGKSRGTKNMIETFAKTGKPFVIGWIRGASHEMDCAKLKL